MLHVSVAAFLLTGDKLIICQTNESRKAHSLINFNAFRLSESLASRHILYLIKRKHSTNSLVVGRPHTLYPVFRVELSCQLTSLLRD